MAQADQTIGVCLYKLDAREEAVLKRVVTFSGAQGRSYVLTDLPSAQLVVVSNETVVDLAAFHPAGAMLIRITDQDSEQLYDVLMQRPLLVTRVMRTLDEARKLWLDSVAESTATVAKHTAAKSAEPVHLTVVESIVAPPVTETRVERVESPALVVSEAVMETQQAPETELPVTPVQTESVAAPVVEPLAPAVELPLAPPSIESPEPSAEYHHRALVVDDSAAIRKQLELELRQAGIASDFAETGEEALQKVASHTYDLVFLDIIMPGIDGYETCRQMRIRREMKKTPIIMLSAKTSPLDEVQGVIAGASTYLTKPVKSDQLQKTLKRVSMWLDNFQQARS